MFYFPISCFNEKLGKKKPRNLNVFQVHIKQEKNKNLKHIKIFNFQGNIMLCNVMQHNVCILNIMAGNTIKINSSLKSTAIYCWEFFNGSETAAVKF